MSLILGTVRIPLEAALGLTQRYEPLGGVARLRLMSGAAVQQVHWRRWRTTIEGDGWWPPGLDGLDYDAPLTLACIQQRTLQSASNIIVLPAARRADAPYTPVGHAIVPGAGTVALGGDLVPTALALVGDTATLTTVTGAVAYQVTYWPQLTVFADPPAAQLDAAGAAHRWSLVAEEV